MGNALATSSQPVITGNCLGKEVKHMLCNKKQRGELDSVISSVGSQKLLVFVSDIPWDLK